MKPARCMVLEQLELERQQQLVDTVVNLLYLKYLLQFTLLNKLVTLTLPKEEEEEITSHLQYLKLVTHLLLPTEPTPRTVIQHQVVNILMLPSWQEQELEVWQLED